jgi:hypothetical protein
LYVLGLKTTVLPTFVFLCLVLALQAAACVLWSGSEMVLFALSIKAGHQQAA